MCSCSVALMHPKIADQVSFRIGKTGSEASPSILPCYGCSLNVIFFISLEMVAFKMCKSS